MAVFREFLASAKVVERLAERRATDEPLDRKEVDEATTEMWLKLQEIKVFCPEPLHAPAHVFVDALHLAACNKANEPVSQLLEGPRSCLFQTAAPIFQEQDVQQLSRPPT